MPDPFRFQKYYSVHPDRPAVSKTSLEHLYRVERVLDTGGRHKDAVGGLNEGVFLVRHVASGKLRVHKRIPTHRPMLQREILLLQVLRHPNVVGFVDACITDAIPQQMSLYMEYCDLGSLQGLIRKYMKYNDHQSLSSRVIVPESFVWHVLHSLASALQYIHYGIEGNDRREPPVPKDPTQWPPILHRDIKPDNILLRTASGAIASLKDPSRPLIYPHWPFNHGATENSASPYPKVVLADFGIATQYHEPDFHNPDRFIGTPHFSPPELPKTSGRGDVWAFGASVLSLCRLFPNGPVPGPPANHPNPERWFLDAECRRGVAHIGPGPGYSDELRRVLQTSLRFRIDDRASSWQLMRGVRKSEERLLPPKGKGLVVKALPGWVYGV